MTTLPGHPPVSLMNRRTVSGSIACGFSASPSSMPEVTSSSSTSMTYSVPGDPPWRLMSIMISAS